MPNRLNDEQLFTDLIGSYFRGGGRQAGKSRHLLGRAVDINATAQDVHRFSMEQAREAAAAMGRADMLSFENQLIRGTAADFQRTMIIQVLGAIGDAVPSSAQLDPGPAPSAEDLRRYMRDAERAMVAAVEMTEYPPCQSYQIIRQVGDSHDITIGRQRQIIGPHIARPFARSLPDNHKATIFNKTKWEQVELTLDGIYWIGRNKCFLWQGENYLRNWKRVWEKTRKEAEELLELKNGQ